MGKCEFGFEFMARDGSEFCFNMACDKYTSQECAQSAFYQRGEWAWPKPDTVGVKSMEKERKRSRRKKR